MGLSGTGKTVAAKYLEKKLPAVRINTDTIHSKMFPDGERTETGDFTPEQLKNIYAMLRPLIYYLAKIAPDKHFIIEGAFREEKQRQNLTREMKVIKHPYSIVYIEAGDNVTKQRINKRFKEGAPDTVEDYEKMKKVYEYPKSTKNLHKIDNSGSLKEFYRRLDIYIRGLT